MKTKDIKTIQTPYERKHLSVLAAFFQGQVLQIQGDEYRYARKGTDLIEEERGDDVYVSQATASGLFKKMYTFSGSVPAYTKEHATGFTYVIAAETMDDIFYLIESMTEAEMISAIASKVLTDEKQSQRQRG